MVIIWTLPVTHRSMHDVRAIAEASIVAAEGGVFLGMKKSPSPCGLGLLEFIKKTSLGISVRVNFYPLDSFPEVHNVLSGMSPIAPHQYGGDVNCAYPEHDDYGVTHYILELQA